MSEQFSRPDRRAPEPFAVKTTAALGLAGGLGIAWLHWLSNQYTGGHWFWRMPPWELIDVTMGAGAPTLHLIARGINRRLEKFAGETT